MLADDEVYRTEAWLFVEHWLSSLHLYAPEAPILMVGTYADIVRQRKQHENISRDIFTRFRHNPGFQQVVHNESGDLWFWPVDNTQSQRDSGIRQLQHAISSEAIKQDYVTQTVALPYLQLYDALMQMYKDTQQPMLDLCEVADIASRFGLQNVEETKQCLKFLHMYSMVLYYDSIPRMDEVVILSPQWTVDVMCRVIRNFDLHRDVRDKQALALGVLWDDLVDRGILHRKVLELLWKDVGKQGLVEPFLDLMLRYGLCVQLEGEIDGIDDVDVYVQNRSIRVGTVGNDASGHAGTMAQSPLTTYHEREQAVTGYDSKQSDRYLVPSLLPMTLEGLLGGASCREAYTKSTSVSLCSSAALNAHQYEGYEPSTAYVCFFLRRFRQSVRVTLNTLIMHSFVPEGLFSLVIAHLMSHRWYGQEGSLPELSRTHCILYVGLARVEMQLVPQTGGMKISVAGRRPKAVLETLYDLMSTAVQRHYRKLESCLLLPLNDTELLFYEAVLQRHREKQAICLGNTVMSVDDIVERYGQLLPTIGLQSEYDVFLSYRYVLFCSCACCYVRTLVCCSYII